MSVKPRFPYIAVEPLIVDTSQGGGGKDNYHVQSCLLRGTDQFNPIRTPWARHLIRFLFASGNSQDGSAVIQTHVI